MRSGLSPNQARPSDGKPNEPARSQSQRFDERNGGQAGCAIHENRLTRLRLDLEGEGRVGNRVDEPQQSDADIQSSGHADAREGGRNGNESEGDGRTRRQHVDSTRTANARTRSNELSFAQPAADGKTSIVDQNEH